MKQIEVYLGGGGAAELSAKKAWISYESPNGSALLTEHFVHTTKQGLEIGAGRIATKEGVIDALMNLGALNSLAELLPEEVLCAAPGRLVWWRPACTRYVYVNADDAKAGTVAIPLPALLYTSDGERRLAIHALDSDKRPTNQSALYVAPLFNVFDDAHVCWGNVSLPRTSGVASIEPLEQAFWHSTFTHANVAGGMQRKGGINAYWMQCAKGKAPKKFRSSWLKPINLTLKQFIERGT